MKQTPLNAKTALKATTGLKARTALRSRSVPLKQPKPNVTALKKKADKLFSVYVRYRDGMQTEEGWISQCITCDNWFPILKIQCGHFMSRRYNATRYEEENNNAQCYRCNVIFYGEQYKYAQAIDLKYGDGTAKKLSVMSQEQHRFSAEELQQIIHDAKEQIYFYESQQLLLT